MPHANTQYDRTPTAAHQSYHVIPPPCAGTMLALLVLRQAAYAALLKPMLRLLPPDPQPLSGGPALRRTAPTAAVRFVDNLPSTTHQVQRVCQVAFPALRALPLVVMPLAFGGRAATTTSVYRTAPHAPSMHAFINCTAARTTTATKALAEPDPWNLQRSTLRSAQGCGCHHCSVRAEIVDVRATLHLGSAPAGRWIAGARRLAGWCWRWWRRLRLGGQRNRWQPPVPGAHVVVVAAAARGTPRLLRSPWHRPQRRAAHGLELDLLRLAVAAAVAGWRSSARGRQMLKATARPRAEGRREGTARRDVNTYQRVGTLLVRLIYPTASSPDTKGKWGRKAVVTELRPAQVAAHQLELGR